MKREDIYTLWLAYLKESNFREKKGEAAYIDYVNRIKAFSKLQQVTPFPTVRKLSDIIEIIIDRAHSKAISDGDISFEHLKKRLIFDIKLIEQTSLLLHIHCPGIPPRGGQKVVLSKISNLINAKLKESKEVREFYLTWSEPQDQKIELELKLYLTLYLNKKRGLSNSKLQGVANKFAKNNGVNRVSKENGGYFDESQISRAVRYANNILLNVEKGLFPGDYKNIP